MTSEIKNNKHLFVLVKSALFILVTSKAELFVPKDDVFQHITATSIKKKNKETRFLSSSFLENKENEKTSDFCQNDYVKLLPFSSASSLS